MYTSKNSF